MLGGRRPRSCAPGDGRPLAPPQLNRAELDSVKKQLENRWKDVEEKLRAQEGPEGHDAAALRK